MQAGKTNSRLSMGRMVGLILIVVVVVVAANFLGMFPIAQDVAMEQAGSDTIGPPVSSQLALETPTPVNPRNLPVITVSDSNAGFSSPIETLLVKERKFVVLARFMLGNTLAEVRRGKGRIGAKYLLDGDVTPLTDDRPVTWQAKIILTETGTVVAKATVTGDVKNFEDLDRQVAELVQRLLASPALIESLSPAEKKSWGL